jgi:cyclic-di-GMP-binding protein
MAPGFWILAPDYYPSVTFPFKYPKERLFNSMPSFDVVSEVDKQEIDNALNQAKKELSTRFDFKDSKATIERTSPDVLELTAEDASRLRSLMEIMVGKLSKRGVDLRSVDRKDPAISPLGHARQEIHIKQGLEGDKAKEITKAIKAEGLNVQCQMQDRQIRVTGKKKDDLQTVIQLLRRKDFGVALSFKNFRD